MRILNCFVTIESAETKRIKSLNLEIQAMEISKLGNLFIDFGLHFFIILSFLGAIF